jgi:hypothetical protein
VGAISRPDDGATRLACVLCRSRKVLDIDPGRPPSYDLSAAAQSLAESIAEALDRVAEVAETADPDALSDLMEAPRPRGAVRRIPQI